MSRITAPVAKQLSRSLSPAAAAAGRSSSGLLDHNTDLLMPKYAELLRNRRSGETTSDSSRHLTIAHRPTPQPSIANRPKPLMQTFSTTSSTSSASPTGNLDGAILPSMSALTGSSSSYLEDPVVPVLPDNYASGADKYVVDAPTADVPPVTIVAADPDKVLSSSPITGVVGAGVDGIDLGFAHDADASAKASAESQETEGGMLRDVWKGMVSDIFGAESKKAA